MTQQYLDLVGAVMANGNNKGDRTGTGTRSIFGWQSHYNLQAGFPLLTTKKLFLRGIIEELLWMLRGDTNIKSLQEKNVHIWDEWADENGDLGPVYGKQWRAWPGDIEIVPDMEAVPDHEDIIAFTRNGQKVIRGRIDQITNVIERIKSHPDDRRLLVLAFNPAEVNKMALPPCHCFFQFYTRELSFTERQDWFESHGDECDEDHCNAYLYQGEDLLDLWDRNGVPRRALSCQLYQRSHERLH